MNRLNTLNKFLKRTFDLVLSFIGLFLCWWIILIAFISAAIDTRSNGFFIQRRVGRDGHLFSIIKIKTMTSNYRITTTITTSNDSRITRLGSFFRKTKIDELPQLWNVFIGDMSFVGPRPDVPGFADILINSNKLILSVRPGITGPATLFFRNEEALLAKQKDPETYNRDIIFPKKICLNLDYIQNWSLKLDIKYIIQTLFRDS